jgi:5-methylcytosine-specific restriction protein A
MAIGQLADYKRFFGEGQPNHLAVLLPAEPRQDLCDLLFSQEIDLIYPTGSGFEDSTGGSLVEGN